ncbi:rho GTPase-activating protein 7, partial [Aplysia californica]|uniref:Rho GTPase-activating protein 7 n=1 Tax=Aplysia californica TaxID=6500 RepID=A0ABM1A6W7_APLCA
MSGKLSRMAASCFNNDTEKRDTPPHGEWVEPKFEPDGLDTPPEKGFANHNWIRSFSERVRNFRSGEFDEGISEIRRRKLAELEAVEALKWLKAAGFPQYAQMFQDGQFPVELWSVERDHDFLDKDSLQSLFRRLDTLNKYAGMKIDAQSRKKAASEDEEEDDLCALSERWEYQKSVRRWSRKDLHSPTPAPPSAEEADVTEVIDRSASHDSLLADQDSGSQTGDSPLLHPRTAHSSAASGGGVASEETSSRQQQQQQQ